MCVTINLTANSKITSMKKITPTPFCQQYLTYLDNIHHQIEKNFEKYLTGYTERATSKNEDMMVKCHPVRKLYADILPLNFEIGREEQMDFSRTAARILSSQNICLDEVMRFLITTFPAFHEFAIAVNGKGGSENLASLLPVFFPHRYIAGGERYFEMNPPLVEMLDMTDVGEKTPCHFMRTPFETIFVEYKTRTAVFNEVSGDHAIEGFYLNEHILPEESLIGEYDNIKNNNSGLMMLGYHIENGYITLDGGDVRLFEIMITGTPLGKEHITDDASFSFSLMIQNNDLTVSNVITHHLNYYQQLQGTDDISGIEFKSITERQQNDFSNYINIVAKTLLYLNSSKSERKEIKEADEIKKQIKRTINKAKQRKLYTKLRKAVNRIVIGSNITKSTTSGGQGRTVKTHWRRGYLKHQRHGKSFSLTKLIFIEPTLINDGVSGKTPPKKNYKVT